MAVSIVFNEAKEAGLEQLNSFFSGRSYRVGCVNWAR
jgi:hypothetical protein